MESLVLLPWRVTEPDPLRAPVTVMEPLELELVSWKLLTVEPVRVSEAAESETATEPPVLALSEVAAVLMVREAEVPARDRDDVLAVLSAAMAPDALSVREVTSVLRLTVAALPASVRELVLAELSM